jgi:hypothetical protein
VADKFVPPAGNAAANIGPQTDPTEVGGQNPDSLFGVPISYFTGASGSPPGGETPASADATVQPNQAPDSDPFTGASGFNSTGAPGSQGAGAATPGGTPVLVTMPFQFYGTPGGGSGIQMVPATVNMSGPDDSTAPPHNYPPARPVVDGDFYPTSTGAGDGAVHVGGNAIRP